MANDRCLAVIPARGGSKRLPRKNVRMLCGKPLIAWSIAAAREAGCFVDVLVSTDDEEIAEVARSHGALVPWLRPAELASDTARSVDVVLHALEWYEGLHGAVVAVALLQPTSPFRDAVRIREGVARFLSGGADAPVVSVSEVDVHPAWTFSLSDDRMQPFCGWELLSRRSQELPNAYALNGALYVASPIRLRSTESFFAEDMRALVMDGEAECLDIDTPEDFERAENLGLRLFRDATS